MKALYIPLPIMLQYRHHRHHCCRRHRHRRTVARLCLHSQLYLFTILCPICTIQPLIALYMYIHNTLAA